MKGLNWQTINLPFGAGLKQSTDDRARPQPYLDIAKDIQFDETEGVQTRLPFGSTMTNIFGGGTISDARRLARVGAELLLFTKSALYTWNAQSGVWHLRATHLAVKIDEATAATTTGDAIECDRAELSNTIVYSWTDGTQFITIAKDKTTGAITCAPVAITGSRPRLVALTTKILLFYKDSGANLVVTALDPADVNAGVVAAPTTVLAAASYNDYYDVVRVGSTDTAILACRRAVTTSYTIAKITAALAVTTSTKARTADGPLAVSVEPTGASVQVIRANGTNIHGDFITISTLVDVTTGQAVGTVSATPVNQIAACHRSVQDSGAYRCYVFWDSEETTGNVGFLAKYNYVDTAGALGTQATFITRLGIASRAFDYDGRVYVHGVFAGVSSSFGGGTSLGIRAQLQNSYFLYRDDTFLAGKEAFSRAAGFSASVGHLPGVALTSGTTTYSWCGTERRIITVGGTDHSNYGARAPRDLTLTFDSDAARRSILLGLTLYVTGAEILQWDGTGLFEVGFNEYPWTFGTVDFGAGAIGAGTYSYKATLRWNNARGEQERSTTATGEQLTLAAGRRVAFSIAAINITHKTGTRRLPAMEFWRSAANPSTDSPFYLTTSKDPAATGDNGYLSNDYTTAFVTSSFDNFADTTLTTKETNPENGDLLEVLAPPAATIIAATDTRIFLAGVAGDPDRVWYSRQRNLGEVASFHDALTVDIPPMGGSITAIAAREGVLYVWRETALYSFPGLGLDNLGQGQNFGPADIISTDIGCMNAEAVALTDKGYLFKSAKGWFIMAGRSIEYIGDAVSDYDDETIVSIDVIEGQHQIRCLSTARMLVLDTRSGQWDEWTITDGLHSVMWQGSQVYLTATGPKIQSTTYSGLTYGMDVETAWIKLAELQGAAAVRRILALGEFRSDHYLRVRLAYDYRMTGTPAVPLYVDDKSWLASPLVIDGVSTAQVAGDKLQVKHGPKRIRCEAIKVRLTAVAASTIATATDLSVPVTLDSGVWTGTFSSVVPRALSLGFALSSVAEIEVRDNESWDFADGWTSSPGTCGVRVVGNDSTATVQIIAIEILIQVVSTLVTQTAFHATPTRTIKFATMDGLDVGVAFPSAFPTGEALKLTGLALEVGSEGGTYRALGKARQQ